MTRRILLDSPSVLEIDLDSVAANTQRIRHLVGKRCQVYAALKCDAYGLGLVAVARTILDSGGDAVSVARPGDAISLREAGIDSPVLLYPSQVVDQSLVRMFEEHRLTAAVWDADSLLAIGRHATRPIDVFLKIDVGLRRLGVAPETIAEFAKLAKDVPKVRLAGVLTHLHVPSDPVPEGYLAWQFNRFSASIETLVEAGFEVPVRMAASSAVLRLTNRMNLNSIDPGRLFFGFVEEGPAVKGIEWRQSIRSFKTALISIKQIAADGFSSHASILIGGGVRVGIIPLGTADGMSQASWTHVLVSGRPAPLFPAISLEHSRIDLTQHPDAAVGDEVVVIGRQGGHEITVGDVANSRRFPLHMVPISIAGSVRRRYTSANDSAA